MGLLTIECPKCGKPHQWFTGNLDQRCRKCIDEWVKANLDGAFYERNNIGK